MLLPVRIRKQQIALVVLFVSVLGTGVAAAHYYSQSIVASIQGDAETFGARHVDSIPQPVSSAPPMQGSVAGTSVKKNTTAHGSVGTSYAGPGVVTFFLGGSGDAGATYTPPSSAAAHATGPTPGPSNAGVASSHPNGIGELAIIEQEPLTDAPAVQQASIPRLRQQPSPPDPTPTETVSDVGASSSESTTTASLPPPPSTDTAGSAASEAGDTSTPTVPTAPSSDPFIPSGNVDPSTISTDVSIPPAPPIPAVDASAGASLGL